MAAVEVAIEGFRMNGRAISEESCNPGCMVPMVTHGARICDGLGG